MARTLILLTVLLMTAHSATAATLQGRVVNGTTGEAGQADLVAVYDVTKAQAEPVASAANVSGAFTLEGIPDAAAAHFRLEVRRGGNVFRQTIPGFDAPVDAFYYDTTDDISSVALIRHHVIFTRDPEHLQVTEFMEFDNRSNPPRLIRAKAFPMRVHLAHDTHGAPTASIWGTGAPVEVAMLPTDQPQVMGMDYALQPGPTSVVVRYLVHEDDQSFVWKSRSVFPTDERRVLASPMDMNVESAGMIPTDPALEGYATWAGLASQPGDAWEVMVSGGSAVAATDDGHDHESEAQRASQYTDIVARPNRLTESRAQIMLGLGGLLLFGTLAILATAKPRAAAGPAGREEARLAVSKVADRFVSGEITREEYEREASRLMKNAPEKNRKG